MTDPTADAIAALTQEPVRCAGCGSRWSDADLARERAANPRILSCCPEREPLTIDQWAERAETAEDALLSAQGQAGKPVAQAVVYCVICIKPGSGSETLHIFSTAELRARFMDADERNHVAYDYTLDAPAREEESIHDN